MTTVLIVNYNTPDYLERLLISFRKFYDTPVLVIDGSDKDKYELIKDFDKKYNVELLHFGYNIHHGPGMAYGIQRIKTNHILLCDSDMIIHSGGWLEMMEQELKPESYGIGDIQKEVWATTTWVGREHGNRKERALRRRYKPHKEVIRECIDYLHPAFCLINREVALKYPLPYKGGSPLLEAMKKIWDKKETHLLQRAEWLTTDLWEHTQKYVQHNDNHAGMGTVARTNGYHLD